MEKGSPDWVRNKERVRLAKRLIEDLRDDAIYPEKNERFFAVHSKRGIEGVANVFLEGKHFVWIHRVAVAPINIIGSSEERRRGIGTRMIYEILKYGLRHGVLRFGGEPAKSAASFWEKIGFLPDETSKFRNYMTREIAEEFVRHMDQDFMKKEHNEMTWLEEILEAEEKYGVLMGTKSSEGKKSVGGKLDSMSENTGEKNRLEIINKISNFTDNNLVGDFLEGFAQTCFMAKSLSDDKVDHICRLAKQVNGILNLNQLPSYLENDRLAKIIYIDSIAHKMHLEKDTQGNSKYNILDLLAEMSKSEGEIDRDDRVLILNQGIDILSPSISQKDGFLQAAEGYTPLIKSIDQSDSFWKIMVKAIRDGVKRLTDSELILLREWIFARM